MRLVSYVGGSAASKTPEVVVVSDGGGVVPAVPRPIHGFAQVGHPWRG